MKKLISAGTTRSGALLCVAVLLLGTLLTVILAVTGSVAEALLAIFMTFLGLLIIVLFSRISVNLGVLKKMSRTIDKSLNGSTDLLLRDIHRQLMELTGDRSRAALSVAPSQGDIISRKDLQEIKRLLQERDDLENQVLRQIVAETRLIRIAAEREND